MQRTKKWGRRVAACGAALALAASGLSVLADASAGAAPTTTTFAAWVSLNSSIAALNQNADASFSPTTVTQGANVTLTLAGGSQVIPTNNNGVPVNYATNNNNMYAVPTGFTYVSSTAGTWSFTNTAGATTSGTETVTYCDPATPPLPAGCTGTAQGSTFLSNFAASPYIEIGTGTTQFTAGGTLTTGNTTVVYSTPTAVGTTNQTWSEFQTTANINLGGTNVNANVDAYPTTSGYAGCSASCTTAQLPAVVTSNIASVTVNAPPLAPVLQNQSASVSNGQCVTINALNGATEQSDTPNPASVTVTTAPTAPGTATANANGTIQFCTGTGNTLTTNSFQFTAAGTTSGLVSTPATATISIAFNTCSAGSGNTSGSTGTLGTCSLHQEIILPVTSGQIVLSQNGGLPIDPLGSSICTGGLTPGITLNGNEQAACGALSPLTVTNSTGLDAGWTLQAQVSDFNDPAAPALTCDTVATYSNHCIPGGNLAAPLGGASAVTQSIVPGDTAQVTNGLAVAAFTPVAPATSTNPVLQGASVQPNPVVEPAPNTGLHAAPWTVCSTAAGQSGGTFVCGAGLELLVPASIAEPAGSAYAGGAAAYQAVVTITLS